MSCSLLLTLLESSKMFRLQNYNEFRNHVRWHDYIAIIVNEFPVVLVRRYDWMDTERYTLTVQVLGITLFQRIGDM